MKITEQFKNGLIFDNPVLVQLIGMCPTLATSTSLQNGIGMGLSATAVLICSNIVISLLRKFIPSKVRIAAYITVIAGFVTMVDMLLAAYLPSLHASLGLFIPLIVVNCIILGRAEAYASKNKVLPSAVDGLTMGLGFTFALACMSIVRELLGNGTIAAGIIGAINPNTGAPGGIQIPFLFENPMTMFILPAGGFLTMGFIIAIMQKLLKKGE